VGLGIRGVKEDREKGISPSRWTCWNLVL
jgi:hypothetical protein